MRGSIDHRILGVLFRSKQAAMRQVGANGGLTPSNPRCQGGIPGGEDRELFLVRCLRQAYSTPVQITPQDRLSAPTTLLSSLAQERSQPQNQSVQNKSQVWADTAFLEILRIAQL